jgi:hypothetical protein
MGDEKRRIYKCQLSCLDMFDLTCVFKEEAGNGHLKVTIKVD